MPASPTYIIWKFYEISKNGIQPTSQLRTCLLSRISSLITRHTKMSGVEVIGLILGVLPLFISAAEHYRDGIKFIKRGFKKDLILSQFRDELTQQKTLLSLYIKGVIGKTSIPARTQAELVNDPQGEAWHRTEVVKEILDQLGDAYEPFMNILTKTCSALYHQIKSSNPDPEKVDEDEMVRQLQDLCLQCASSDGSGSSSSKSKPQIWERVKFSWKTPEFAAVLVELKTCNSNLERLSVAADRARPYERKQKTRRAHVAYEFRDEAHRLFQILCKACTCQGTSPCEISLRLQRCTDEWDDDLESKFQMLLFESAGACCQMSARISKPISKPPPKKKVRIQESASNSSGNQPSVLSKSKKALGDICSEARAAHSRQSHLNIFIDEKEDVWAVQTTTASKLDRPAQNHLTLADVMTKFKLFDHKRWLHREKAILAVVLSYSLLQLHNSPWLQTIFSTKTITFDDSMTGGPTRMDPGADFRLRRPYMRSTLKAIDNEASGAAIAISRRRNAHIHALGTILLELHLNRSIEEDVLAQGGYDYRGIAQDLLEDHADDITMTPEYLKAVRFCLSPHPNPYSGSYSFEDKGFREIFYSEVIFMLEENLTSRFEIGEKMWKDEG